MRNNSLCRFTQEELEKISKRIGVKFREYALLELVFVHKSFAHEKDLGNAHNERLEFLGDSVLGMVTAEYLYCGTSNEIPEGVLSRFKSIIVSETYLVEFAKKLRLGQFIRLGRGEKESGGDEKPSILADTFEALVGALFLDQGFEPSKDFLLPFIQGAFEALSRKSNQKDHKTLLQEMVQKKYKKRPVYRLVDKSGPEHLPIFRSIVLINGEKWGTGSGKTKLESQQNAAAMAYEKVASNSASQ